MKNNSYRKKQPTEAQIEAMRARRSELKELSKPLKKLLDSGEIETINEGLTAIYAQYGHEDLKTLKQWNKEGKRIIKGEHALLLWGKPQPIKKDNPESTPEEEEKAEDFFPICFVFSASQVEEGRATA